MTLRRRLLALALVVPLLAACQAPQGLELRENDSLPEKAGKVVLLVPVFVGCLCLILVGAAAQQREDAALSRPPDYGGSHGHPDFAPGPREGIF